MLDEVAARHRLAGVVNNVGLVRPQPLEEVELDDLWAVLDLNLRVAVQTVQAALPAMRADGWGRIVNIQSLTVLGVLHRTSYAAAKAALISFTRSWALELATTGITVNAVPPGPTETELFRENNPAGGAGEARYLAGVPMRRFGRPDEVAAAIAFSRPRTPRSSPARRCSSTAAPPSAAPHSDFPPATPGLAPDKTRPRRTSNVPDVRRRKNWGQPRVDPLSDIFGHNGAGTGTDPVHRRHRRRQGQRQLRAFAAGKYAPTRHRPEHGEGTGAEGYSRRPHCARRHH